MSSDCRPIVVRLLSECCLIALRFSVRFSYATPHRGRHMLLLLLYCCCSTAAAAAAIHAATRRPGGVQLVNSSAERGCRLPRASAERPLSCARISPPTSLPSILTACIATAIHGLRFLCLDDEVLDQMLDCEEGIGSSLRISCLAQLLLVFDYLANLVVHNGDA